MRFARLHLTAFGPFQGSQCDFPSRPIDFHILHGPNEAGKSSLLRAIEALLFGIEERSEDNFRVPYPQMLLGAALEGDGRSIEFTRRKGRTNTLCGPNGKILGESGLASFLNGVDRERFRRLYGLNRQQLADGAKALAEGQEEAAGFFEAGGLLGIGEVLTTVEATADKIFSPRARSRPLNEAIGNYRAARKEERGAAVSLAAAQDAFREVEETRAECVRLKQALADCRARSELLVRVKANLTDLATLADLQAELDAERPAPSLPPDFPSNRASAQTRIQGARSERLAREPQLENAKALLSAVSLDEPILVAETAMDALKQQLGAYQSSCGDLPKRQSTAAEHKKSIEYCLRNTLQGLGESDAKRLVTALNNQTTVSSLLRENTELHALESTISGDAKARVVELSAQLAGLPDPPATDALAAATNHIRTQAGFEGELKRLTVRAEQRTQQLDAALAALPGWSGSLDELERLAVPLNATVLAAHAGLASVTQSVSEAQMRLSRCRAEIATLDKSLTDTGLDAPTQEQLNAARDHRDSLWHDIADFAFDGALQLQDLRSRALVEDVRSEFARRITTADALADGRFDNAETLGKRLGIEEQRAARLAAEQEACRSHAEEVAKLDTLQAEWRAIWGAPLPSLAPVEALEWLEARAKVASAAAEARSAEVERSLKAEQISASLAELGSRLSEVGRQSALPGESLATLLVRGDTACKSVEAERARRQQLINDLERETAEADKSARKCEQLQKRRAAWRTEWNNVTAAMAPLAVTPDNAEDLLSGLGEFRSLTEQLEQAEHRIAAIQGDIQRFEYHLHGVATSVQHPFAGIPSAHLFGQLESRLGRAKEAAASAKSLRETEERLTSEVRDLASKEAGATAQLRQLMADAQVSVDEDLPRVESASQRRAALTERIAGLRASLLGRNSGRTLQQVQEEAKGFSPASIEREVFRAHEGEASLVAAFEEAVKLEAASSNDWKKLGREADHAAAAQNAAVAGERIAELSLQYARLQLTASAIREAMRTYQEKHEGALLQQAGSLFAGMTRGSFQSLTPDYDSSDHPVLKATRAAGSQESVGYSGMSDGTRDQFFLSLRLAAIGREASGIPLILDEILEGADEDRTKAILSALAEFAKTNQVLLFTHHAHVAESGAALGANLIRIPFAAAAAV